jgi:hypothetical protein
MALSLLLLAAGAGAGAPSIEGIFLQYGLIGAVALALGLYARSAIKSTEERANRLEEDNRRLYALMAEQFVPALTKSADAVARASEIMGEIRKRDEINAAVEASRKPRDDQ